MSGLTQKYPGLFYDKGGSIVNVCHPDFGAKCDNVTDDTDAILAAIDYAIPRFLTVLIPGRTVLSDPITDAAGRLTLQFMGRRNSSIRWNGTNGEWVFQFTSHKSEIYGGCLVLAYSAAKDYEWNGIKCSGLASRTQIPDVIELYKCKNGVKLITVYGCELKVSPGPCSEIGIDFDSEANANTVDCSDGCTGKTGTLGTIGVRNDGSGNICKGQQLSEWVIAYKGEAYSYGTMLGHFVESNTTNVSLLASATLVWDCAGGFGAKMDIADGADFVTPFQRIHPSGLEYSPSAQFPLRSLSGYYPVLDASITALPDRSGNRRNATVVGTWGTTSGPYGYAVSIGGATNNTIRLPASVINSALPWAIAILIRPRTWVAGVNRLLTIIDGSGNYIFAKIEQDTVNMPIGYNGSAVSNFGRQKIGTDQWTEVCFGYDPTVGGGTVYNLNPYLLAVEVGSSAAPMTNIGATSLIEIGGSGSVCGVVEIARIAVWSGRIPSRTELYNYTQHRSGPIVPINEMSGATSVADGGTVTHGMGSAPTMVSATPSTSGEFVSVTAISSTTFTVAIKKHDGTAGTTQTIYWRALK